MLDTPSGVLTLRQREEGKWVASGCGCTVSHADIPGALAKLRDEHRWAGNLDAVEDIAMGIACLHFAPSAGSASPTASVLLKRVENLEEALADAQAEIADLRAALDQARIDLAAQRQGMRVYRDGDWITMVRVGPKTEPEPQADDGPEGWIRYLDGWRWLDPHIHLRPLDGQWCASGEFCFEIGGSPADALARLVSRLRGYGEDAAADRVASLPLPPAL